MRPSYSALISSVQMTSVKVVQRLKATNQTDVGVGGTRLLIATNIRDTLYPDFTLSMPGKEPRTFRFEDYVQISHLQDCVKLYSCGRTTIKLTTQENRVLSNVANSFFKVILKKRNLSCERKDFNTRYVKRRNYDTRQRIFSTIRDVIGENSGIIYPKDLTDLLLNMKKEAVVRKVMDS